MLRPNEMKEFIECQKNIIEENYEPEDFKCNNCRENIIIGVLSKFLEQFFIRGGEKELIEAYQYLESKKYVES